MTCSDCDAECRKFGRNRNKTQRYRCPICRKTLSEPRKALGSMYLPLDKARLVIHLLVEGNSIRSTERITGVHHTTILALLEQVGRGCTAMLRKRIRAVAVNDLEMDEVWTFVGKKQRRLKPEEKGRTDLGDAYCFYRLGANHQARCRLAPWQAGQPEHVGLHHQGPGRHDRDVSALVRRIRSVSKCRRDWVA